MSEVVEERRAARVGTVSGLALLTGGTAVAAVGAHSIFAAVLLGMLAAGMGHALLDEIRRQARRRSTPAWARHDTVNTVLLASWAAGALIATVLAVVPVPVRAVGLALTLGYAGSCAYFVAQRRRTIMIIGTTGTRSPVADSSDTRPGAVGPGPSPPSGPGTGSPCPAETGRGEVVPDGRGFPR